MEQSEHYQILTPFQENSDFRIQEILRQHNENYNYQFYKEHQTLCQIHTEITNSINSLIKQKEKIYSHLIMLQTIAQRDFGDRFRQENDLQPSIRRPSKKVHKKQKCEVAGCFKTYGSLGSMLQHMSIKHPDEYEARKKRKALKRVVIAREAAPQNDLLITL